MGFTTSPSGKLAAGNTITATFNSNVTVPATPTVTLGTGFTGCTATASATGGVVTITLAGASCAVNNSTAASLTIAGITNPGAQTLTNTTFKVATAEDTSAVSPGSNVVIAAATAPSAVSFSPGSTAAHASSTWSVGFTTSASGKLAAGNTITATFNSNVTVPATPTVTLGTGFTGCTATASATGGVVTITLAGASCAVNNSTAASLTIAGITNPGAGSYANTTFKVATSEDTSAVSPASGITITAATPTAVSFSPGSAAANASSTWSVGFTTSAIGNLVLGNTITATLPSSFTVPATPTVTLGTGFTGCTATASATGGVVTITLAGASCAVNNSTAASLTIAGITNPGAGTYTAGSFSIATSKDTIPASPSSGVTINATDDYSYAAGTGTGTAPAAGSGLDGTSITLAANTFTEAGYTFAGWSDGSATYDAGSSYLLASNGSPIVLTATWTANATDTLTFNSEGGSTVNSESGLQGTTVTLPSAPSRAGYVFAGWFAAPSGGSAFTSPYTLTSSVTLYAQWTANPTDTLTFNSEGGSTVNSESGLQGTTVTLPSAPSRAGYVFAGWFAAPSGGSAFTSPYTLTSSVTLYAQWTANATDDYSYAAGTGTGTAPAAGSGLDGTSITLAANTFTEAGYTFAGWSDGSATYDAGSSYLLASNGSPIVLTATWTANATDDYSYAAGTGTGTAPAAGSGLDGTSITLAANTFTEAGYTFAGWSDGSATYDAGSSYLLASNGSPIVLTATWTANATDDYSYAAGTGTGTAPAAGSGLDGTSITLAANTFTEAGYTFAGWSDGSATYDAGSSYLLASNGSPIVLTATWTANATDDYSYAAGTGTGTAPAAGSGLDGTSITLAANTFTEAGYTFAGWSDGSATYDAGSSYLLASNGSPIVLTATWTANATDDYSYAAGTGTGTAPAAGSGLDGTSITLAANTFTEAGYTFAGWSDGSATYDAGSSYLLASNGSPIVLTATWTANATDDYSYAAGTGTGTAPAAGSGLDGTSITLAANTFTEAGYTFAGWSDGSATYDAGSSYLLASNGSPIVLTATWTANATDDYSYAAGTGTGTAPAAGSGLDGTSITLAANTFTEAGYTFAGWSDGSATYDAGSSYLLASNGSPIVLTATWTANATDDYSYAAGTGTGTAPAAGSGLDGTSITLAANTFTEAGYTFAGWSDGSATYDAGSSYLLASNGSPIVLTATWTANATDDYSYAAGTGTGTAPAAGSGLDGTSITLAANTFTEAGYTFAGWSDGSATYDAGSSYLLASNGSPIVLTATWTANATDDYSYAAGTGTGTAPAAGSGLDGTSDHLGRQHLHRGGLHLRWVE